MKIVYSHLVKHIKENPSIKEISESLFQLGHEHEIEGNIFNMELTPNRGDCLSINGLLRELSVFYTVNRNQKIYTQKLDELILDFENSSQDVCPKISFLRLKIDKIPHKYKEYLNNYFIDLDLNKNNFFTDISNYLSYETGQPTHCYDANQINGKLVFAELDLNTEFETLLDKKINLTNKNAVFLLDKEVINLAGIIGGKKTSCSYDTKEVLIECAFFKPEAIISKSIKYDIQSEASHKFERFVDPECQDTVLRRFINIVDEHVKIKDLSIVSYNFKEKKVNQIPFDVDKINKIIGIKISEDEYLDHISKLGFIKEKNQIIVPSFRDDIRTQNDLAEEVARVVGYDNILKSELSIPKCKTSLRHDIENKLRYFLIDHGFYEVINSPFVGKHMDKSIRVDNPLDSNKEFLRTNLIDSLLDNLIFNERRQKDSIKLFEISDVYSTNGSEIKKVRKIAIIGSGRVGRNYKDFSKKINIKHLSEVFREALPSENFNFYEIDRSSLNTKIKNNIVGCEINIDNFSPEILNYKEQTTPPKNFIKYSPISELPFSKRDLSFSIKDFSKCKTLEEYILSFENRLLKDVFIFDYFHNKKNAEIKIGFRFIFQSSNSTITESQVNDVINVIIKYVKNLKGISIPGLT